MYMQKQKPKPEKIRRGNVTAVIWKNRSREGSFYYKVEFVLSFKKPNGDWEDKNSYSVNDLLMLQKVADLAFDWIYEQKEAEKAVDRDAESECEFDDDSEE
jgi:hypothetical protein